MSPAGQPATTAHTLSALTLEEARKLRDELARFSKTSELPQLDADIAASVREEVLGEPFLLADVLHIPPWRLTKQSMEGVELTWTLDLGHESGTRLWLVAHVARLPNGWKVGEITLAHAHALRRPAPAPTR